MDDRTPLDRHVIRLHHEASGATADVVPSLGFNLVDLKLPVRGRLTPIIACAPDFLTNPAKPSRNGVPVLFPFPNRIANARYEFDGKDYQLPANNGPNAIHGFALTADWEIVAHGADERGAFVTGRYQISRQSPESLPLWPADGILELTYRLAGSRLGLEIAVENPSPGPLPFGFGIHPYFHLPFGPSSPLSAAELVVPASEAWVQVESIPTGERRPVEGRDDLRAGRRLDGVQYDDLLTGLPADGGACRLIDHEARAELVLEFDRNFREFVVFTPYWFDRTVAVEPYTQATDAINLRRRGIDAGLRVLAPGERVVMTLALETRDLA